MRSAWVRCRQGRVPSSPACGCGRCKGLIATLLPLRVSPQSGAEGCAEVCVWWVILEKRTSINSMNSPPDKGGIFPVDTQRNVFISPGVPWDGKSG